MVIKTVVYTNRFEKNLKAVKDRKMKERIAKQLKKIIRNPGAGKPLRFDMKGEKTVYIKLYRLVYYVEGEKLILLRFLHRKEVYR